jgi:hypothetical protein
VKELTNIATFMAVFLAGLEIVLLLFKESISRVPQAQGIEKQIMEARAETIKARELTQIRQAELTAAKTRKEAAATALRQATHDVADAPAAREIFIHEVGEPGILPIFRASLRRTLSDKPEPNQVLFWSYENFVDVWATNPDAAERVASRLFAAKAGYELGRFRQLEKQPEKQADKAPATSEEAAA